LHLIENRADFQNVYKRTNFLMINLNMENIIKRIFSGKSDAAVHSEFIKFSKGTFTNKYLIDAKKQKDKWSIKTSAEFANFLVRSCLEKVKGEIAVKGVIISTFRIENAEFPIAEIKNAMGTKKAVIDTTTSPEKIIKLMDQYPRIFYALSFSNSDFDLKIKAKAAKSAKPSTTGDKEVKAEFCSLKTNNLDLVKDLLFDCENEPFVSIKHTLQIDQVTFPKNEKDPVQVREKSVRKGKIIRIITTGEEETKKETKKEASFEA